MSKYKQQDYRTDTLSVTEFCLHRSLESPVFDESAIRVRLEDEGSGPFLVITNTYTGDSVTLDFHELDKIYCFAVECWRQHFQFYSHSPEKEQECDD